MKTILQASILSGLAGSINWTIYGVYLTLCSKLYAKIASISFIQVQTFVFGISTSIFLFCKL